MNFYGSTLSQFKAESRYRSLSRPASDGLIDLTSNDYLGLAAERAELTREFFASLQGQAPCFSSSASRLLVNDQSEYFRFESLLEQLYGKPCLLFNSGWHCNTGLIQALAAKGTLIVSDKLNHASIIDGVRLSGADSVRLRHNDIAHLRKILETKAADYQRILVITESVFSMDGDMAPLREMVALKKEFPTMLLYVDEAHAVGVRGERGLGMAEELGLTTEIDVIVGTLGKALFSMGAYCITSSLIKDYLVNTCRPLIFSTALPPINVAWSAFIFDKMTKWQDKRLRLKELARKVGSESHIFPFIVGDAERAVKIAEELRSAGILALPIRRPTVPPGTERIRFSLNAALTDEEVDKLCQALEKHKQVQECR